MSPGGEAAGFDVLKKAVAPDHPLPRDLLVISRLILE